jgi:hypothetical protein
VSRIPFLGGLFGNQALTDNRTELVLFITPRVVENETDVESVIDGLRRRMERLDDVFPVDRDNPPSPFTTTPKLFPSAPFVLPSPEKQKLPAPPGISYTGKPPAEQTSGVGPGQIAPQDPKRIAVPAGVPVPTPAPTPQPAATGSSLIPPPPPSTVPAGASPPLTPPPPPVLPPPSGQVQSPGLVPNPSR